jgi:hypothetical protein
MRYLVVTVALSLAACSAKPPEAGTANQPSPSRSSPQRQGSLVTAEEIQRHGGSDLYEVLRALRPTWFRTVPTTMRGGQIGADPLRVYLDGRRLGTVENMGEISVAMVSEVRYYRASEAQGRFGLDNTQGAIEIITTK